MKCLKMLSRGLLVGFVILFLITGSCLAAESADSDERPIIDFKEVEAVYREDLTEEFGEELTVQMRAVMGSMADMFKIQAWIYEVPGAGGSKEEYEETVETVLEGYSWPEGTTKIPLQEDDFGYAIERMLNSYEEELNEAWGSDWSSRAREAVKEYENREMFSRSYVFNDQESGVSFSITVISPFASIRTFEIYEGVFINICQMSISI